MTSTFPASRSNLSLKYGINDIQSKKEALISLESALKKRINELRELCLKEGELTGHLPIDYPLQPREPIPQIRRRTNYSTNNLTESSVIAPPCTTRSQQQLHQKPEFAQPYNRFAIAPSNSAPPFPSRPTSTNSTSSSISSSTSSHARNINTALHPMCVAPIASSSSTHFCTNNNNNGQYYFNNDHNNIRNLPPISGDQSYLLPNYYKRNSDTDSLGQVRVSPTASSSSSSLGSGNSSTLSAPVVNRNNNNNRLLNGENFNLHGRSCSESITTDPASALIAVNMRRGNQQVIAKQVQEFREKPLPNCPPPRPPRGFSHHTRIDPRGTDSKYKIIQQISENREQFSEAPHLKQPLDVSTVKPLQHFNDNGNFQPFYEETKPFQMSDFYKYSSKHRVKADNTQKTTRQLQEEISKKNPLKFVSCDDQIQASVKSIEKSGQKLIQATARALAGNPGLAEKINNLLPTNNGLRG